LDIKNPFLDLIISESSSGWDSGGHFQHKAAHDLVTVAVGQQLAPTPRSRSLSQAVEKVVLTLA